MGQEIRTDSIQALDDMEGGSNNDHPPALQDVVLSEEIAISSKSIKLTDGNEDDKDDGEPLSSSEQNEENTRRNVLLKAAVGVSLLGFVCFVVIDTVTTGYAKNGIDSFLQWVEDNPAAGVFLFIFVYAVATVLFIPGSVLTLGAGFVFAANLGLGPGVVLGSVSVFFGASLGAVVAFVLGRYLLRDQVAKLTQKYALFEAIDSALEDNGLKIFVLLRLSPIIPFNAINYIAGVTAVSLRDYSIALIAIVPGTVLYVFLGASAGSLTDSAASGDDPTVTIVIIVVGILFGVAAVWVTSRYAKKELHRVLEQRRLENDDSEGGDRENCEGLADAD